MSDMQIQIRPYCPDDIDAIIAITGEVFGLASIYQAIEKKFGKVGQLDWCEQKIEDVQKDFLKNPSGCFVAQQGGRVVGYITTLALSRISQGHIINMAVSADAQNGGVGRKLMEKSLEYFHELGLKQAKIETLETNHAGQHLYPSVGFTEVLRQITYVKAL